jgi:hypothetical protein
MMTTEILTPGVTAGVPSTVTALSLLPDHAGQIVMVALGLVLLVAFLRQILFMPVEEERPAAYRSLLREPLPPEL